MEVSSLDSSDSVVTLYLAGHVSSTPLCTYKHQKVKMVAKERSHHIDVIQKDTMVETGIDL